MSALQDLDDLVWLAAAWDELRGTRVRHGARQVENRLVHVELRSRSDFHGGARRAGRADSRRTRRPVSSRTEHERLHALEQHLTNDVGHVDGRGAEVTPRPRISRK